MSSDFKGPDRKKFIGLRFAWNGLKVAWKREKNFRIHLLAGGLVLLAGLFLQLDSIEWAVLVIIIAMVISMELINSGVEQVMDYLAPERHPLVGQIKDITAGAVLVAAIASIIIAGFIFIPKLISFF